MTNQECMSFWKGGDASEVLRFTDPYEYEGCLIGVSTDGRAVYDFMKVMEYIYEQEKDNYDVSDFEDEDDLRYNIMMKAEDMINHDLGCYNPADKIPVFCRTDEDADDDEFMINDSPYDNFSTCTMGPDFREYRYIFSLSQMVEYLVKKYTMEKVEAVRYVYSLKKAGTVEHGVYNYIIVDDLYENINIDDAPYQEYNNKYSADFEKECFELSGKDFSSAIRKINEMFRVKKPDIIFLNYIRIKKTEDSSSQVFIDASDKRVLTRFTLDLQKESSINKPLFLNISFVSFLASKIGENDTVKIFTGNDCLFVKVNEEIYSITHNEINYPAVERAIPKDNPLKAEISVDDVKTFINSIKNKKNHKSNVTKLIFTSGNLTLKLNDCEKIIPCTHNCEEGFSVLFDAKYIEFLTVFYDKKIVLEIKDSLSALKINKNELITVFMPINPKAMS